MKAKKVVSKTKKKKTKIETPANAGITKVKKQKIKKIKNKSEVAESIKKECAESQKDSGTKIPIRQQTWNQYLKVFRETERLNEIQTQIMEFCTNKSLTPPRRKQKFLNFIRNCFENQKDVTDEQCNELFDLMLNKYDDYKSGAYTNSKSNSSSDANKATSAKPSKNKKKKLNRASNDNAKNLSSENIEGEEKWQKTKGKKRKQKASIAPSDNSDVEMDE